MTTAMEAKTENKKPSFEITTSRLFTSWLASQNASIAFTTYQAGKVFLIGIKPDGSLSVFERTIERPMALHADNDVLYLSSLYQLYRFQDVTRGGQYENYDRLYAPRVGWVTGDIDIHDIKTLANGEIIFVNTLFSCLATASDTDSFCPVWQPPFISKLAAEDRCHMNGLAMGEGENAGKPAYVTAVARTDVADGWRDHRPDGGILVDVAVR